jgi:hypothetical protein
MTALASERTVRVWCERVKAGCLQYKLLVISESMVVEVENLRCCFTSWTWEVCERELERGRGRGDAACCCCGYFGGSCDDFICHFWNSRYDLRLTMMLYTSIVSYQATNSLVLRA